jgi:CIC family chloride channel protein
LNAPVLGSVVLASATSWAMLRLLLGNDPLFKVPQYQLVSPVEFLIYAVLGLFGGLLSVAFTKLLLRLRERFLRLPRKTMWFQPAIGGVVVGIMGWFVPQTLGVGYSYVGQVLNGGMVLRLTVLLLVVKFFAVVISYASGNAGGIFGPALFLGAMLGGAIGSVAHNLFPAHVATAGAYALVGMGTAFAGIVRAPMTSVVMIFETTRDYAVIVPLMISNLVSFFVSSRLQRQPIYEVLAYQDGIHLPTAESRISSGQRRVIHAMRPADEILKAEMTTQEALERVSASALRAWPVSDERGVAGIATMAVLKKAAADGLSSTKLIDLIERREFPHLHADQSLAVALERMGAAGVDALPVVSRADVHKLEGIVAVQDVLRFYGFASHNADD